MNLPQLYLLDDYSSCVEKGNDFCTFVGYLSSKIPNNVLWEDTQLGSSKPGLFDRSLLHRARCIPREYSGSLEYQKQYSLDHLRNEVDHLNLTARVGHFTCIEAPKLTSFDYGFLVVLLSYYIFYIAVSICDKWIVKKKNSDALIWNFSIFHNWTKVVSDKNDRDYQKLKCIQGLRFFLMAFNLLVHTLMSYVFVFLDDPIAFEKKMGGVFYSIALITTSHIVQPFFLISAWLCTVHIYDIYDHNGKFTYRDLLLTIVNRYFRLIPLLAFICFFISTNWLTVMALTPHAFYPLKIFQSACQNNILPTLLFVNNYYLPGEMCNLVTWYLSADFQFYVLVSITMYLILKYKCSVTKVLTIGVLISWFVYGTIIYVKNLDMVYLVNIRPNQLAHFLESVSFNLSYTATHTSLTTPIIGMMFGFIYIKNRHRTDFRKNKTLVALWYIIFYGLLLLTVYLSSKKLHPIITALLGPLLKPTFAFSIGVGILGMSHGFGGITKRILESEFAVLMGNFSFGTFITHVGFCFTRGFMSYELYPASRLEADYVLDLVLSFMTGAFMSLSLEQPASVLQKMILPQIKKKQKVAQE